MGQRESSPPPATGCSARRLVFVWSLATAPDLQMCLVMANQAQLETASTKQTPTLKGAQDKELKKRPPLKKLPPPDEDVLIFLPIG